MKTLKLIPVILLITGHLYAQPANNDCTNAITLTAGFNCTTGDNTGATLEAWENAAPTNQGGWASVPNNTVWYKFTPTASGVYTVTLDDDYLHNASTTSGDDSQVRILTGTCGAFTAANLIAENEDGGYVYPLAAEVSANLIAGTTYYIQVDIFGTAVNNFCISVLKNSIPQNDCVNNAIDISGIINAVSPTNAYSCNYYYQYNAPGNGTADAPTKQNITGDPNGCNGLNILMTPIPDHFDVWFKFTVTAGTPPAYLQLFPSESITNPIYSMALYSGTPVSICPTGNITGLTQIDCSDGRIIDIPPGNDMGGVRDQSLCTTPIHPRIDVSGLAPGTYYIRVWEFNGLNPPGQGMFNLCAESIAPRPNTVDTCSTTNIGYMGTDFNASISTTYSGLSNAGMHGNACQTAVNEPLLGATPAGQARDACAGGWITYVGAINNVMNNTALHIFNVNSCPGCEPTALVQLNNIVMGGTIGNVAQLQVMAPGNCTGSTQTIMNGVTSNSCIEMRPAANVPLANGNYYIVVDGQDGQLLTYDLTLTLTYPCTQTTVCTVLPIELIAFTGKNVGTTNHLHWETASEINNDHFDIERSADGIGFETIATIPGAGNSNELLKYDYADRTIHPGYNYYRLKQTDYDGEYSYSEIIVIRTEQINPSVELSPNPVNDKVRISVSGFEGDGTLQIYNSQGMPVYSVLQFKRTAEINISELPPGNYLVRITNAETGEPVMKYFVKN
jgi:hypothetical protein